MQPDFGLPVFIAAAATVAVDAVTLNHSFAADYRLNAAPIRDNPEVSRWHIRA
jgi:hypothetical protein